MLNRSVIFRIYIIVLVVSLAAPVQIHLFSIPQLSAQSFSLGFFGMSIGLVFPFFFVADFMNFIKEQRYLLVLCLLFVTFGAISALHSPLATVYSVKLLLQYGLSMGISFILLFLFSVDQGLGRFFLKTFTVLAILCSLIAMIEVGSDSLSHFLSDTFRNGAYQVINGRLRPAATLMHPNTLGCFLSMGILLLILQKKCFRGKNKLFYSSVLCLTIGIAFTGSRNAMVVLGIPLVFLLFNKKIMKSAFFVLIISAVCLVALTPSLTRITDVWRLAKNPKNPNKEIAAVSQPGPHSSTKEPQSFNSAASRFMLWESAIEMFKDHPAFGIGPGCYNTALKDYASESLLEIESSKINQGCLNAHNGFFNLLAEFGIAGVIAKGGFFVVLFWNLIRRYGIWPPSAVHAIVLGLFISFVPDAFFCSFYIVFFFTLLLLFGSGREDPLEWSKSW